MSDVPKPKLTAVYLLVASMLVCGCSDGPKQVPAATDTATPVQKDGPHESASGDETKTTEQTVDSHDRKSRSFEFRYGGTVQNVPQGAQVQVWLPVPESSEHQKVQQLRKTVPGKTVLNSEPKYGNRILYFQTTGPENGEVDFEIVYHVQRNELQGLREKAGDDNSEKLTDTQRDIFLAANRMVPIDGKPIELLAEIQLPAQNNIGVARALYNRVDEHMHYDKSQPGYGRGDVLWACDSRFGNCTDFHSLFIAMSRAKGLPARFEIGFPLPPEKPEGKIGGYHCWAFFHVDDHGWVPVDISEADKHPDLKDYYFGNLTADRVSFSVGRDIVLTPKSNGQPLNYFIYPYVEVDGKVWPGKAGKAV